MPLKYASPSGPCCWRPTIEDASLPGWEGIPGTSTNLRKYTLAYEQHLFLLINNWTSESGSRMKPKLRRSWTQRIYLLKKTTCSTQQQILKTCCFHTNTSGFSTSSRKLRFTSRNHFKKYTNSGMPFVKGARLLSLKMEEVPFENNLRNCKRKMCTETLVVGPREIASTFIFLFCSVCASDEGDELRTWSIWSCLE